MSSLSTSSPADTDTHHHHHISRTLRAPCSILASSKRLELKPALPRRLRLLQRGRSSPHPLAVPELVGLRNPHQRHRTTERQTRASHRRPPGRPKPRLLLRHRETRTTTRARCVTFFYCDLRRSLPFLTSSVVHMQSSHTFCCSCWHRHRRILVMWR